MTHILGIPHDLAQRVAGGVQATGSTVQQSAVKLYGATLGPTGHALRQVPANVIGGAGQLYNDFSGGVKGAYAGAGNFLNRSGDTVQYVVREVPATVRDITIPTGRALETGTANITLGVRGIGEGVGGAIDKTGSGLGDLGKYAGFALIAAAIVAVIILLPKLTRGGAKSA